ncbi:sulfate transporter [Legionella norrlandica]|uniref:Sulfate transporter n=1 Tax=Legionella norrlandica TaxID=1498499 RepID=A0A0A2SRM4_9GAMM|nr:SulP family inorganic anion transporter [Legionella norrlandica]KGP63780.1 sulfate transporter [Legionella norrlandica]
MTRSQSIWAILTGLVIGIDNIIIVVAFSSIIYQGMLANYIPFVINLLAIAVVVIGITYLFMSSPPYAIAQLQDEAAILYSSMALVVIKSMPPDSTTQEIFITVLFFLGLTTFITGLSFYLVGKFRFGNIIRYLPYPVICGFLAATGWLILSGTFALLTGKTLQENWFNVLQTKELMLWMPGFIAGFLIYLLKEKLGYQYSLHTIFISLIILFYGFIYLFDVDHLTVLKEGYLLGPFSKGHIDLMLKTELFKMIHFPFSITVLNYMGLVLLVSFIALLLNASSYELLVNKSVDLNKELRLAGFGNVLSGLIGGTVGYLSLSASSLAKDHADTRATGIMALIPMLLILLFGTKVIEFFPKAAIGAYLFYIAISFLSEWLIDTWRLLNLIEYLIVLLILVIAVLFNMISAVAIGTVISIFIFAFRYSKVNPVKYLFSGAEYNSSFERSPISKSILSEQGDKIRFLKLQGFLFFGSIYKLFQLIKSIPQAQYIILDFELVYNIDSSRITLMKNLKIHAEKNNLLFVICSLKPVVYHELVKTNLLHPEANWIKLFSDQESALEWCEGQLLEKYTRDMNLEEATLEQQLHYLGFSPELVEWINEKACIKFYNSDDEICHEGDESTSVYFIHRGKVSAFVGGKRVLIVGSGNVLGEIAMYTHKIRTATLKTNEKTIVYEVSLKSIQELSENKQSLLIQFHMAMARILANRLTVLNKRIKVFDSISVLQ